MNKTEKLKKALEEVESELKAYDSDLALLDQTSPAQVGQLREVLRLSTELTLAAQRYAASAHVDFK
jgi:hypothetical protein